MDTKTRHRIGIYLLVGSVLAAFVLQLATNNLGVEHPASVTSQDMGPLHVIVSMEVVTLKTAYVVPLAATFIAGLLCLIVPPRPPPKIPL